jgi:hypothetical protein
MASERPAAGSVTDPDGREVVLPARIWDHKISRDHPELIDYLEAVMETVAEPDHIEPDALPEPDALLPTWRRAEPLADGGRKL